jgi:hypothetical protein
MQHMYAGGEPVYGQYPVAMQPPPPTVAHGQRGAGVEQFPLSPLRPASEWDDADYQLFVASLQQDEAGLFDEGEDDPDYMEGEEEEAEGESDGEDNELAVSCGGG